MGPEPDLRPPPTHGHPVRVQRRPATVALHHPTLQTDPIK